jgi:hypothetical protein
MLNALSFVLRFDSTMQSTQQNQALSSVYSPASVPSNSPVAPKAADVPPQRVIDRSFVVACCLGGVTVIFGLAALIYQFAPEFSRLKNSVSEAPQMSNLQT